MKTVQNLKICVFRYSLMTDVTLYVNKSLLKIRSLQDEFLWKFTYTVIVSFHRYLLHCSVMFGFQFN